MMENSDLTAIVKELMAIFAPKKEESQKFERQIDTPKSPKTDEKGQNFPHKKEVSPGAGPPSSTNPFAPQTSPEQRYQNFLLRHEEQKRKMQKEQPRQKNKTADVKAHQIFSLPLFPEDNFPTQPPKDVENTKT
jgi:hypothetical protein